ncbi:MAG: DNA mismatch repair protein MutS [Anaerovoracaceae bacterium]
MALSPMMKQYMGIKEKHQDSILFFRLGDFYEMFFEDAITSSRELELTLTGKNCGLEERAPMCGVPFHSAETYIAKLVSKGYKVAICEQISDPATSKGIVEREVIQIITPGTITSSALLNESENNFLASIYVEKEKIGLAYCDISTGEIYVTSFDGDLKENTLINEIVRIAAKEIIINDEADIYIDTKKLRNNTDAYFTDMSKNYYDVRTIENAILRQFNVKSLKGIGLDENNIAIRALGAQLLYLLETQKQSLEHITKLNSYQIGNYMALDKATIKNLEITETLFDKKVQGSLLGILDKTHTAMGGRKMKKWLKEPLNTLNEINSRLDAVEALVDNYIGRNNIKESLKVIYDFERLAGKIACGTANAKDLIALKNSIFVLPEIKFDLKDMDAPLLNSIEKDINPLTEIYDLINEAIVSDPPFTIKEGHIIKEGYSEDLDELNHNIKDAREWISNLENTEKERTGIKNLKVGYNKVFGYYLEITKSYYDSIPENYIRKQTLANAERFITPELKTTESLVLNAEAKINQLEYELFVQLRAKIKEYISLIQKTSAAISSLDVLTSFAEVADKLNYVKPLVDEGEEIIIVEGKHPVIEQTIKDGIFVSNDTFLNKKDSSMLLITGPNMAGKSTYMRQTALIVLMAQAGCFVPCESAKIGITDRIFTRIGASDNLAGGQSTFFVEMSELAYILNTATSKSLVILDEIGRGTSTYDGLSIAFAAVEYLCKKDRMIRTLFATHYHELTSMEKDTQGFKNLNVDVAEENGEIVFLHKIIEGSASRSYGIHVAKLAGVPEELLDVAKEKLDELESTNNSKSLEDEIQIQFKLF